MGVNAEIWASRLEFGGQGWDMSFEGVIWVPRPGGDVEGGGGEGEGGEISPV